MKKIEKKINLVKLWRIIITLIAVIGLGAGLLSLYFYNSGTWVCINTECVDWATGDEWVARNCRANDNQTDLMCKFSVVTDGIVRNYERPLSELNTSLFRSCIEPKCKFSVYVK